jgi:hypothetical protein
MQLDNVRIITSTDYPEEMEETIDILGGNLNDFMQQVVELSRGNIDFDNTAQELFTIEVTVGTNGIPTTKTTIKTTKKAIPQGFNVIGARNLTAVTSYPTGTPFISFSPKGNFLTEINHISNLPANQKFRLTFIVY